MLRPSPHLPIHPHSHPHPPPQTHFSFAATPDAYTFLLWSCWPIGKGMERQQARTPEREADWLGFCAGPQDLPWPALIPLPHGQLCTIRCPGLEHQPPCLSIQSLDVAKGPL